MENEKSKGGGVMVTTSRANAELMFSGLDKLVRGNPSEINDAEAYALYKLAQKLYKQITRFKD